MPHNDNASDAIVREPFKTVTSRTAVIPVPDIDTDQIIPARFLTTTSKEGLGEHAFSDWRYKEDGSLNPDFILNKPEAQDCTILVAGRNFGCGSSREHAPWALSDFGLKAVISSEIADIFRNNALKNGLLPLVVDEDTHKWLLDNPGAEVTIDLQAQTLSLPDKDIEFKIEPFARTCLLNGVDQMGFLLSKNDQIETYEKRQRA